MERLVADLKCQIRSDRYAQNAAHDLEWFGTQPAAAVLDFLKKAKESLDHSAFWTATDQK